MKFATILLFFATLAGMPVCGEDFGPLCANRAAIERVYYHHRPGEKPPFEQLLPREILENLVRQDLRKEAVLRQNYGVEITPANLTAEAKRLDAAAPSPAMLAEIKAALGHDPARFAEAFVRPMLVERRLHEIFDNDEELHAPQRQLVEQARAELLGAKTNGADCEARLAWLKSTFSNAVIETTWRLGAPAAETNAPTGPQNAPGNRTAQNVRSLYPPSGELPEVLLRQLQRPGDVSTVIETPGGYLLCVTKAKTDTELRVTMLSLPKCGYEQWLQAQCENLP